MPIDRKEEQRHAASRNGAVAGCGIRGDSPPGAGERKDTGLKPSGYNLVLPLVGRAALFNGATGAIDVVPTDVAEALERGELDRLSPELRDALEARGFLNAGTPDDELYMLHLIRRFQDASGSDAKSKYGSVVILPTYNCNCRCPYCFEKHRLQNGEAWLKTVMTRELADAVLESADRIAPLHSVTLFGGEPFLPETHDIVAYICEKARALGATSYSVITNGTYLDAYQDVLTAYPFKLIQITLDGPKEIHDRRRFLADGGGTYDVIMRNIGVFLSSGSKSALTVRVNVDGGTKDAAEGMQAIFDAAGFTADTRFSFYCHTVSYDERTGNHLQEDDLAPEMRVVEQDYARALERGLYFPFKFAFCGANQGMLVADPFGDIYTCWDNVGDTRLIVGKVDVEARTINMNSFEELWRTRRSDNIPPCNTCVYVGVCGGGCGAHALNDNGDLHTGSCDAQAADFRRVLTRNVTDWLEAHPERANEAHIPLTASTKALIAAIPRSELIGFELTGILPRAVKAIFDRPTAARAAGDDEPPVRD